MFYVFTPGQKTVICSVMKIEAYESMRMNCGSEERRGTASCGAHGGNV